MSNPYQVGLALAAASANNIATSQTPTSGTALTLNGSTVVSGVAVLDTARRVLLTFGNEGSARTMVLSGTSAAGAAISETLAVPSGGGGTVGSVLDYKTVTSLVPAGGGWTAAVTVGTNGVASTPWHFVDYQVDQFNIGLAVVVSGTINYTVEYTYDDPNNPYTGTVPTPFPVTMLASKTANADGSITGPVQAIRLTQNSFNSGGTAKMIAIQAGLFGA